MNPCRAVLWSITSILCGCSTLSPVVDKHADAKERVLSLEELFALEKTVSSFVYPVSFQEAFEKLGGDKALRWSAGSDSSLMARKRSLREFAVISGRLKGKGYVIVFEGVEIFQGKSPVTRVALGFVTPLGPIYFADLSDFISPRADKKTKG